MNERDDIRDAVHAWLTHQGYTTDDIEVGETDTHEARGCEWCPNHMTWDCIDEETGKSRHPMWDALEEAVEFVLLLDELGWRKVDPAADTHTEWAVDHGEYGIGSVWAEDSARARVEHYRGVRSCRPARVPNHHRQTLAGRAVNGRDLFVDDERAAPEGWDLCQSAEDAIDDLEWAQLTHGTIRRVSLDHDLGYTTDTIMPVLYWMRDNEFWPKELYVHTANEDGEEVMLAFIRAHAPAGVLRGWGVNFWGTSNESREQNWVDING